MRLVTVDAKDWDVKYIQSKETISVDFKTGVYEYADFVGSKLYHNSTSSDKYTLSFAIHRNIIQSFLRSIKKVYDPNNIAIHKTYKNVDRIILEHPDWGAIRGNILGELKIAPSLSDSICTCIFQEHTEDNAVEKKDIENENETAVDGIDSETSSNFDVDLSVKDKSALSKCADRLNTLYSNIKNSSVVSAFNDLDSLINSTTLDSLAIMNAFKNIISLPNEVLPDLDSKITMLQYQATAIKDTPVSSYNLALFNANALSYNIGVSSRTPFVSDAALEEAAGIKSVSMT